MGYMVLRGIQRGSGTNLLQSETLMKTPAQHNAKEKKRNKQKKYFQH